MVAKYKTPRKREFLIESCGWLFLLSLFAGIWYNPLRWKLITTGIVFLFFAIIYTIIENDKEKEFKEKLK